MFQLSSFELCVLYLLATSYVCSLCEQVYFVSSCVYFDVKKLPGTDRKFPLEKLGIFSLGSGNPVFSCTLHVYSLLRCINRFFVLKLCFVLD